MKSEIKPICGNERVKLADAVPLNTPFSMFVFPTTYCNFKCNYCGHSLGFDKMKEKYGFEPQTMDFDVFKRVIGQASCFHDKFRLLSLTGQGEPLLNPYLPEMIAYAKKSGIAERIEIISNAALLTHEKADRLDEAGLDSIRISLQGLSSEKYKKICGADIDFDKFVDNIRYLYERRKSTKIYVKIMNVALEEGEEQKFYDIFGDITDRMYIEQCKPVYDGVAYDNVTTSTDRYGNQHDKRDVCPLCFYMLSVFPNGDVVPCDAIYKPVILGNVMHDTLTDMWSGEKLREFQRMHLKRNRYSNPKCKVCCAPDDVAHPEDSLDEQPENLFKKFVR
jgi:GTP 3',8-cyclase